MNEMTYDHKPLHGLPASLLAREGKTIAVIALMQRKGGLNRDLRRELASGKKKSSPYTAFLGKQVTPSEIPLLSIYLNPDMRFKFFWRASEKRHSGHGPAGTKSFALALDMQLLDAYDPDWHHLTLDESLLEEAAVPWSTIRERIHNGVGKDLKHMPLGVFMLWPQLLKDVNRWDSIDKARRTVLAHAVFALSSISLTDWFVRQALEFCPELHKEFSLMLLGPDSGSDLTELSDLDEEEVNQGAESKDNWRQQWLELLVRLGEVGQELSEKPSLSAINRLVELSVDFKSLAPDLPDDSEVIAQVFDTKLASLIEFCRQLQAELAFDWLDDRILKQIESRWMIALRSTQENDELIVELAADAEAAQVRGAKVADQCRAVFATKSAIEQGVEQARAQPDAASSLIERRTATRRRTDLQQKLLDAEAAIPTFQDDWLAAVSPDASPFDHMMDYTADALSSETSARTEAPDEETRELAPQVQSPSTLVGVRKDIPPAEFPEQPEAEATDIAAEAVLEAEDCHVEASTLEAEPFSKHDSPPDGEASPHQVPTESTLPEADLLGQPEISVTAEQPYSEMAGSACRPVWLLLSQGRLSLAYQAARALEQSNSTLKVPPTDLLACVALAHHLTLPDGSVQETLSKHLARLDPQAFAEEGPHAWNTALNLLLVAGTLRSMVLVPSSGAATIAGYVRLDGCYSAVYGLVQSLRHFSERLQGFRIEPATLRLARSEAASLDDLKVLGREAQDWLYIQAPAMTIKYAPATKVWINWVTKPEGLVSQMVAPVISNRQSDLQRVKELIATVSDSSKFHKLVHSTDRKLLKRKKGEEIHSRALEHLARSTENAASLARRWVTLVDVQGQSGDRMRTVLLDLRAELGEKITAAEQELNAARKDDNWGLVKAAQSVLLGEVQAIWSLFDPGANLPPSEPSADKALGYELLLIPRVRLRESWQTETSPEDIVEAIAKWVDSPGDWRTSFEERISEGDMFGAELIVSGHGDTSDWPKWQSDLRREMEGWRGVLRREAVDTRREIEVGSAYGYLNDSERGALESDLVRWEAQVEQIRRFDLAKHALEQIRQAVQKNRDERSSEIRRTLEEFPRSSEHEEDVAEIDRLLTQGDIATANELLQRLTSGLPLMPEGDSQTDKFHEFFPALSTPMESWLDSQSRKGIESAIRQGQGIPGLNFRRVAGAQRDQAAEMFSAWSDIKSRKQAEQKRIEKVLNGLGVTIQQLRQQQGRLPGREVWLLDAQPIEDRNLCLIPHFGSSAHGKYRLICVWERPTEDEIVQLAGDSTLQRSTIMLYFGRMTERKWRELSRIAKSKRRSFILVDEVMLVYLCSQAGSRLPVLFNVALPFAYSAPYDATAGLVPPEMFYGRSAELDAVRGLNGRCFIYGGRQLGKTALLRRAEQSFHRPSEGQYSCWVDLRPEGIGVSRAASELWVVLTEKLKSIGLLDDTVMIPSASKKGSVESVIAQLHNFLVTDTDRRVLLLLDEADRFFEQDGRHDFSETRRLKQLMDVTGRRFKVVFAGLHNVLRMTERENHPLAHFGEPIKIGPLIDEHEIREAQDLVYKPMAAAGFEFESPSLVIRILAQTNYYPSLIQLYCSHLLRHMLESVNARGKPAGPRYRISGADIESVYSSGALRDEIRTKFRLTLQLDPRYEVVAYGMALEALHGRYKHNEGIDWHNIRLSCAMHWWAEGFLDTSELDFRVLLDEMVELGVLRQIRQGRYTLRNPNVLLLLGSQEEIEAVLIKDREPSVEFESAIFRPALRTNPTSPRRGPLTYQQLSELLRPANTISAISGSLAGGVGEVYSGLKDYLGQTGSVILLDECADRPTFGLMLDHALKGRTAIGITVIVVPASVPWSALWLQDARKKMNQLRSESKHVSLVFVADAGTLWGVVCNEEEFFTMDIPWMTLLPWREAFVRHWLEELQLPNDPDLRKDIHQVTGYWPMLLLELVEGCTEAIELRRRIAAMKLDAVSRENLQQRLADFGLDSPATHDILLAFAQWKDPIEPNELATVSERDIEDIKLALRWADLLGIARMEGGNYWSVDPVAASTLIRIET